MKQVKLLLTFALSIVFLWANAQTINTKKSEVKFKVKNMKVANVKGHFKGMKGEVSYDSRNKEKAMFNVCIDASTVSTKIKKRDEHLCKEGFLNVAKYPTICFQSTKVELTSKGYVVKGNLTLHGVTKEVEIPFLEDGNTLQGTFQIKRFDYKIGMDTGVVMVSDEIDLTVICVLDYSEEENKK